MKEVIASILFILCVICIYYMATTRVTTMPEKTYENPYEKPLTWEQESTLFLYYEHKFDSLETKSMIATNHDSALYYLGQARSYLDEELLNAKKPMK